MAWRLFFGLVLALLGIGFLCDQLDLVPKWDFVMFLSQWWPLVIMATGLNQLVRRMERPWGSLVIFAVGVVLLVLAKQWTIPNMVAFGGGLALLSIGIRLTLPRRVMQYHSDESNRFSGLPVRFEHTVRDAIKFGGLHYRNESQQFHGGDAKVIFGDYELDLRDAALLREGAELRITAIFGTAAVRIPPQMNVTVVNVPILGSVENRARLIAPAEAGRPTLRLSCVAIVGAVEITN